MEWHINELSLAGQFSSPQEFRSVLEPLLKLQSREAVLKSRLYCSRSLGTCQITAQQDFRSAVISLNDRTFRQLVFRWIDKAGPFWTDDRADNEDDYFECEAQDVTEQGLGEAARRKIRGTDARVFSFEGGFSTFSGSPIEVIHWHLEAPFDSIHIDNYWELAQLLKAVQQQKIYKNWNDVDLEIKARFSHLVIADDAMNSMLSVPFSRAVTDRIFELLRVLDKLVVETNCKGALSDLGQSLLLDHFTGQKAWFTDESATNKREFEREMTFTDPEVPTQKIFCGWHGKIKTPQIRIHFQWPRPKGETAIKIVYIGPKLTKR